MPDIVREVMDPKFQERVDPKHPLMQRGIFPRINGTVDDCLARDSLIRLADGSFKAIQDLIPATPENPLGGDVLMAADGVKAYVVAIMGGPQRWRMPILEIQAEGQDGSHKQHTIRACVGHTFIRGYTNGIRASMLRTGDRVQSEYCESLVTNVRDVEYRGEDVWDVYLGSEAFVRNATATSRAQPDEYFRALYWLFRSSLMGLSAKEHFVYANGFLVGDLVVQSQVHELDRIGQNINLMA